MRRDRFGWWRVRLLPRAQIYTDTSLVRAICMALRGLRFDWKRAMSSPPPHVELPAEAFPDGVFPDGLRLTPKDIDR